MNLKLLFCALFGHDFSEHWVEREMFKGKEFIVEQHDYCSNCGLAKVDRSGRLELYKLKSREVSNDKQNYVGFEG